MRPLARLLPFVRPYAKGLFASLVAGLAMVGVGLLIPPLTGAAVDAVRAGDRDRFTFLAGAVLVVGVAEAVIAFARRYLGAVYSTRIERDLRDAVYQHLQRLPMDEHDRWQSGQLLSRIMGDLSTIRRFVGFGSVFLVLNTGQLLAVSVLMLRLHPWLTLFTVALAVPTVWATIRFRRRYHEISRAVQDEQGNLATLVEEAASGIRVIKAFGRGDHVAAQFRAQADVVHATSTGAVRLRAYFWSLLRLLPALNMVAVAAVGSLAVVRADMTAGELTTFVSYLLMLSWPISSMGWILANAEEAVTGAERVLEILDTEPEIRDRPGALGLVHADGHVRFEDVWFRYPQSTQWILRGVDLAIEPGETLALVGATGCGKTTAAMLVPRLYDASRGRILLDGHDLRDLTLHSLRTHIGVAFEDAHLFSLSVADNLRLGRPEASDDELLAALETANAGFVNDLPYGLDTKIGEQGLSLSGGQRQRLALARAIIGSPRLLVLDDPLSAVDVHTEAIIEAALHDVLRDATALLVAHRPSTLELADRVALLDGGRVVATGTHHELLALPQYRRLLTHDPEAAVG